MADATSSASGSGSGSSGHSESRRRINRRSHTDSSPSDTNRDSSLVPRKPSSEQSLGQAVELLQSNYGDRETAKRAVAIVLRATRKRGFKGAVSICTEVTSLLEQNQRLERLVFLQKNELLNRGAKSKKTASLSDGSHRSYRRSTENKANQIKPVLVDRSTSPLLKEVHVKSSNNQTVQTEISSLDTKWRLVEHASHRGCPILEETDENETHNNMTKAEERLKLQEENARLRNELSSVKNELESLKKKAILPPIISEGYPSISKTVASLTKQLDQQSKGKNILPVPPTQRPTEPIIPEVELPHIPQARSPVQALDGKVKVCDNQRRKKGIRPFSSPVKVFPNMPSQRQPIRPVEMYAQCKCLGCRYALSEESAVALCDRHTTDKKSPKWSEILPCIGDHVVVRSHLTGLVKYIGPVSGEKQSYVGLHLDSPVGNHNGSVDGVYYFYCPPNYGALVPVDDVLCITSSNTSKEKQDAGSSMVCHRSSSSPTFQTHKTPKSFYTEKSS